MSEISPNSSAFWMLDGRPRTTRKVRSDAVLKRLRPAAQELVISWCETPADRDPVTNKAIAGTGGDAHAKAKLAEIAEKFSLGALRVSERSLSEFRRWFYLELDLSESFEVEEAVREKTGDAKKARQVGETWLIRAGLARQDPKLIMAAAQVADSRRNLDLQEESGKTKASQKDRQLAQKDEDLKIAKAKFRRDTAELFVEWHDNKAAQEIMKSGVSNAEKIEQLGLAMFGEDWKQ